MADKAKAPVLCSAKADPCRKGTAGGPNANPNGTAKGKVTPTGRPVTGAGRGRRVGQTKSSRLHRQGHPRSRQIVTPRTQESDAYFIVGRGTHPTWPSERRQPQEDAECRDDFVHKTR